MNMLNVKNMRNNLGHALRRVCKFSVSAFVFSIMFTSYTQASDIETDWSAECTTHSIVKTPEIHGSASLYNLEYKTTQHSDMPFILYLDYDLKFKREKSETLYMLRFERESFFGVIFDQEVNYYDIEKEDLVRYQSYKDLANTIWVSRFDMMLSKGGGWLSARTNSSTFKMTYAAKDRMIIGLDQTGTNIHTFVCEKITRSNWNSLFKIVKSRITEKVHRK